MKKFRVICVIIALLTAFCAVGCGGYKEKKIEAKELTANMNVPVSGRSADSDFITAFDDFSIEFLLRAGGENVLISPLSAAICLSMIFNGADGETLAEFERMFGGIEIDALNEYFKSFIDGIDGEKVKVADSIWVNSDKKDPTEEFLKRVKSYYNSEVYKAKFDSKLVTDINNWAANKTEGMIKEILNQTSPEFYMYLLNALYFESKWGVEYEKDDIKDMNFRNADGTETAVKMMCSTESRYFSVADADCFMKNYEGGRYAFMAMLPKEGEKLSEFIGKLKGEDFKAGIDGVEYLDVEAKIPEFSYDYSIEMKDLLIDMGIPTAFSPIANFTKMRDDGGLKIDFVLQKTRIELDRNGTKAAAVTIGGMKDAAYFPHEKKTIILDRPFVYGILDTQSGLPLFLGAVNKL